MAQLQSLYLWDAVLALPVTGPSDELGELDLSGCSSLTSLPESLSQLMRFCMGYLPAYLPLTLLPSGWDN